MWLPVVTPVVNNKMDAHMSPLCWTCNSETDTYIQFLWSCVKLQRYWSSVGAELTVIFGMPVQMYLMFLLLGLLDSERTDGRHRRLFNRLSFSARKNILIFWMKDDAPTLKLWHNTTMDCNPRKYMIHVYYILYQLYTTCLKCSVSIPFF